MADPRPGDPADRAADGAFGGVQSHRAGYGDDKLARLTDWLRAHPTATLASGEGALLLGEIDQLRDDLQKQADWADWAKGEIDRLERILAALREPSEKVVNAVHKTRVRVSCNCLAVHVAPVSAAVLVSTAVAVAAAEQEVS